MDKVIAARRFAFLPEDTDAFSIVSKLFYGIAVRDRFGVLNQLSPFNWTDKTDEIPTAFKETVALGTIMDEHMAEILAKTSGKIVICWSGGVDSTALVCAYLRSGAPLDQMTVVHTEESVEEYPFFYELMRKQGVDLYKTDNVTETLSEVDCDLILSGWCADQLFGSDVLTRDTSLYNEPWVDALRKFAVKFGHFNFSDRSVEILEAVYGDYMKKLGLPVEQWCEFAWMMNFGCKWTYVQNEVDLSLIGTKNYGKSVAFYEDMKFQRWSWSRFERIRKRNPHIEAVAYKRPLKQYILNYTADQSYFNLKGKMASRRLNFSETEGIGVLTDAGPRLFRRTSQANCLGCAYRAVGNKFRKGAV